MLAALACVLVLGFAASGAKAEIAYAPVGEMGAGSFGEYPAAPTAIAIEESSGYVLAVEPAGNRVLVFESSEPNAALLTTFGEGELSSPTGIAIDQTDGSIYISDAGNNRIVRYTSDGATPPTYTLDAGYTSPAQGSGAEEVGSFAAQLAVDPANGDLLVADPGNNRVERFTAAGTFVSSFDGADSPGGAFTNLLDVTVAPTGALYVVTDGTAGGFGEWNGSRVEEFAADGTYGEPLPESFPDAHTVAFDPRTESVLIGTGGGLGAAPTVVVVRENGVQRVPLGPGYSAFEDLASPQSGPGNVVKLTGPGAFYPFAQIDLLNFFDLEATIDPVSAITRSSAHLSGSVDTNEGAGITAHFEYRADGEANWTSTADQPVPASASPTAVEEDLSGLLPAETYEVRLVAGRTGVSVTTATVSFTTEAQSPSATTLQATGLSGSAATLNGTVTPEGTSTTYFFEYGPTAAYGSQTPAGEAAAGAGRVPHRFSANVTGLTAGAAYHYRIVAKNAAGTTFGEDVEFTTPAAAPPGRAYEQVTPVDQQGGNINGALGVEVLPAADGIAYLNTPVGGDAESAPKEARLLSLRGSSDWGPQIHVDPPLNARTGLIFALTGAVSDDGTHALVVSNRALAPGGSEGRDIMNVYMKDLRDGSYAFVGTTKGEANARDFILDARHMVVGASPNFDWIVFWSSAPLLPGLPSGGTSNGQGNLYRWSSSDGLTVESLTPEPVRVQRYRAENTEMRQVSADGKRVFFQAETGVYLRQGGQTTAISKSELDETVKSGELFACSASGRFVFFTSEHLTANSPEGERSLYRYDLDTEELEFIYPAGTPGGSLIDFARVLGVSDDGLTIYFIPGFGGQTVMWRNGDLVTLPPPIEGPSAGATGTLRVSPNGRYAGIWSNGDVYLFDAETHALSCASCEAGSITGTARVPTLSSLSFEKSGVYRVPQWVSDEGSVYFTTDAGLDPGDVNGVDDVYESQVGAQRLISPGDASFGALFMDISADGRDVYFLTNQPLVPRDTNQYSDIYDARRGGGFSVQQQVPAPPCAGESCQSPAAAPPPASAAGSEVTPPAPKAKKHRKRAGCKGKRKQARAKGSCHKRNKHRKAKAKRVADGRSR